MRLPGHPEPMQVQKRSSVWLPVIITIALLGGFAGWTAHAVFQPRSTDTATAPATIEEVRAHPNRFAGKRIRLVGRLSECFSWECSLCPETMTQQTRDPKRCLALEFRPLIPGTGFGEEEQEQVLRFSSVVLDANFDPSCWTGLCTDRQTVLTSATISSVTKRRANRNGLWLGDYSLLHELTGPIAEKMRAAALRAGFPINPPIKAFATDNRSPKFVVCWSSPAFGDSDPGAWPQSFEGALYARSTLDFYRCNEVRDMEGQLVVQAT